MSEKYLARIGDFIVWQSTEWTDSGWANFKVSHSYKVKEYGVREFGWNGVRFSDGNGIKGIRNNFGDLDNDIMRDLLMRGVTPPVFEPSK